MPNLVLTGFMGTGKTAVARCLAARLGRRLLDTDDWVEQRHGPIDELFATHGEAHFRRLERRAVREAARSTGLVVATGGGAVLDRANALALATTGTVVCLTARPGTILARVGADGAPVRPLLEVDDPLARIRRLLAARADAYGRFPQVATDHLSPGAVAERILRLASIT